MSTTSAAGVRRPPAAADGLAVQGPAAGEPIGTGPAPAGPDLPRRSVVRGLGLGAVTVVVAATGALAYRAHADGVLDAGAGTPYDAWSHWRDDPGPLGAVAAAILAANPHNSQPWVFRVTSGRIDVFTDPTRRTGTLDTLGREHQVGLGCALENLVLAAAARGYRAAVTLLPVPADPTHVATVALGSGPVERSALYEAIGARHSNRGPYRPLPVPGEVLASLGAQAAGLEDVRVHWFTAAGEKAALGELLVDAARAVTADTRQSTDAFAWFRSSRADIDRHRDGLTLDGQGLDALTLGVAKLLPAESRTAGDAFWVDQTRTVHTRTAAAYGVVTVTDPADPRARLLGGRLLQRVHLAATAGGLALQHLNQVTERIDREQSLGLPATFAPRFAALLAEPGRRPLATFRVGHAVRAARPSPRRSLVAVTR